mmetsp:Transcript_48047/g.153992  ORF Transcript_48047/g.153992 Transcript_48047/m.153992 type:complete len:419 (-) Transcript_48047:243-1499(-)
MVVPVQVLGDLRALLPALHQHPLRHERRHRHGEGDTLHGREVLVEAEEVVGLHGEVELLEERGGERLDALLEAHPAEEGHGIAHLGNRAHEREVPRDDLPDPRVADLDRHHGTLGEPRLARALGVERGLVDLRDASAGHRRLLHPGKDVVDLALEGPLDGAAGELPVVRGRVAVELGELLGHVAREEVVAGCCPLSPLDEGGPRHLEGPPEQPQPLLAMHAVHERHRRGDDHRQEQQREVDRAGHRHCPLAHHLDPIPQRAGGPVTCCEGLAAPLVLEPLSRVAIRGLREAEEAGHEWQPQGHHAPTPALVGVARKRIDECCPGRPHLVPEARRQLRPHHRDLPDLLAGRGPRHGRERPPLPRCPEGGGPVLRDALAQRLVRRGGGRAVGHRATPARWDLRPPRQTLARLGHGPAGRP